MLQRRNDELLPYIRALPYCPSALNVDTHVTAQMRVFVFAFEVPLAGIDMTLVVVGEIILCMFCHDVPPGCFLVIVD